MDTKIARSGMLLCVDSGEYSNYLVTGFFVVLRDFDPRAELDTYLNEHPDQCERYGFEKDQFLSKLLEKGLLLEIEYGTLYLGQSNSNEEFNFTPGQIIAPVN